MCKNIKGRSSKIKIDVESYDSENKNYCPCSWYTIQLISYKDAMLALTNVFHPPVILVNPTSIIWKLINVKQQWVIDSLSSGLQLTHHKCFTSSYLNSYYKDNELNVSQFF